MRSITRRVSGVDPPATGNPRQWLAGGDPPDFPDSHPPELPDLTPVFHWAAGDAVAEAYAMVQLVDAG
ncbi:MAG: hypothetical protein QME96_16930, partial [Myxococcota bacterium]|nr:hypothetical protein [Myxococcota bacterium]